MLKVVLLVALSTVLIAAGGFVGKVAWEKYRKLQERKEYVYQYFQGNLGAFADAEDARNFRNGLDLAKRRADDTWVKRLGSYVDKERIRRINDYVFRVLRDIWFAQQDWHHENGRYFQGKNTMPTPPDYRTDGRVELAFGLTDQVDDWRDVGYADKYAPVSLRGDVYDGPRGQGFIVLASVQVEGKVWVLQMHHGPEERDISNYMWVSH